MTADRIHNLDDPDRGPSSSFKAMFTWTFTPTFPAGTLPLQVG